ncbi:hypothetical protein [Actinoallomurus sp. CA-142502]|uniref:hypothetical protein n=1 Tax=Actinoallomurus sp. CA-142502 TaxID=3239885 RepID=UPI003D8E9D77
MTGRTDQVAAHPVLVVEDDHGVRDVPARSPGTVVTSALLLVTILVLVIYPAVSRTEECPADGRHVQV